MWVFLECLWLQMFLAGMANAQVGMLAAFLSLQSS